MNILIRTQRLSSRLPFTLRAFATSNEKKPPLRGVDKSKVSRKNFLYRELTENPEFFNAFPHLQPSKDENPEYQPIQDFKLDIPKEQAADGFFESLQYHHKDYEYKTNIEKLRENEQQFVDAYRKPEGPMKWLSVEEKEKIHNEIDLKMQELEDTGLSREEIVYNISKGLPLIDDPLFQYLKHNKIAREMLFLPNEEFNAEKAIEKALRQDFGADPSVAIGRKNIQYLQEEVDVNSPAHNAQHFKDQMPALGYENYYYGANVYKKKLIEFGENLKRPAKYINKPHTPKSRRKDMMRHIKKEDIHWRNMELLTKFLNPAGKMMNRYQTRLPTNVQKKFSRTIKHARNLGLLPFSGFLKATDKINVKNIHEDLESLNRKLIDPVTGKIYKEPPPTENEQKSTIEEYRFRTFEKPQDKDEDLVDSYPKEKVEKLKELRMDDIPFTPNRKQIQWIEAQAYLLNENADKLKEEFKVPSLKEIQNESSYKSVNKKIESLAYDDMYEGFLKEKSYDVNFFDKFSSAKNRDENKPKLITESVEDIRLRIANIRRQFPKKEDPAIKIIENILLNVKTGGQEPAYEFEDDRIEGWKQNVRDVNQYKKN